MGQVGEVMTCPWCGEELKVNQVVDVEHCGDEVVLLVQGCCLNCDKNFEWEEIFTFHSARRITTIE